MPYNLKESIFRVLDPAGLIGGKDREETRKNEAVRSALASQADYGRGQLTPEPNFGGRSMLPTGVNLDYMNQMPASPPAQSQTNPAPAPTNQPPPGGNPFAQYAQNLGFSDYPGTQRAQAQALRRPM